MNFRCPAQMMRLFGIVVLAAISLLSAGCAGREAPAISLAAPTPSRTPAAVPVPGLIYRETGVAAWYGKELHGKKTASGEVFDQEGISAAHRTLPFNALVRVTNLDNLKSIKVRINDRGPFIKSRILELSYGAARELGFTEQGTARVTIETPEAVRDSAQYTVQAAAYTEEENAKTLKYRLSKKFEMVAIVPLETNIVRLFCVRVGSYASEERAEQIAGKLTIEGLEPIVLRKD